jgi:phosphopantetheine--protein transferase-like protein
MNIPQLKKVLSEEEISYCLKIPSLSSQRFAARFAAREAFFKAFCSMQKKAELPFLTICKSIKVVHTDDQIPLLEVNWQKLLPQNKELIDSLTVHCSLTHTEQTATAFVVIEQK